MGRTGVADTNNACWLSNTGKGKVLHWVLSVSPHDVTLAFVSKPRKMVVFSANRYDDMLPVWHRTQLLNLGTMPAVVVCFKLGHLHCFEH